MGTDGDDVVLHERARDLAGPHRIVGVIGEIVGHAGTADDVAGRIEEPDPDAVGADLGPAAPDPEDQVGPGMHRGEVV